MSDEQRLEPWPFQWLRTESFHAWFSWIEWLGVTAVLITAALKAKDPLVVLPISALAVLSVWFVFCYGIASFTVFLGTRLRKLSPPPEFHQLIGIVASGVITCGVLWSLVSVLRALLEGGA